MDVKLDKVLPPFDPARADGENPSAVETLADDGRLAAGQSYEIPARQGRAFRLPAGCTFRIINTHGTQVGDFWAFVDGDLHEFLSMEHVRSALRRTKILPGDGLVTNRRRPILKLIEDSSPGVHDTLIAACDLYRYAQLGHEGYHDNCTDNLRMALSAIGLEAKEIPCPLNLWMNTPAREDGSIEYLSPVSRPGDHVRFQAEMSVVIVVSCCPMDMLPINGPEGEIRSLMVLME